MTILSVVSTDIKPVYFWSYMHLYCYYMTIMTYSPSIMWPTYLILDHLYFTEYNFLMWLYLLYDYNSEWVKLLSSTSSGHALHVPSILLWHNNYKCMHLLRKITFRTPLWHAGVTVTAYLDVPNVYTFIINHNAWYCGVKPEWVHAQNTDQSDAYDCKQNVTEHSKTSGHRIWPLFL